MYREIFFRIVYIKVKDLIYEIFFFIVWIRKKKVREVIRGKKRKCNFLKVK